MTLLLAAAVAGLFGAGPMSDAIAGRGQVLWVEYDRFTRLDTRQHLTGHLEAASPAAHHEIALGKELVDAVTIEHVVPEPDGVTVTDDALVYRFATAARGRVVRFELRPTRFGLVHSHVRSGDAAVDFRQLIYP